MEILLVVLSLCGLGATFWFWGYTHSIKETTRAEESAKRQKELTHAKAKEAEIYSRPAGSKFDIISRL